MKKIISAILALVLIVGICTAAMAENLYEELEQEYQEAIAMLGEERYMDASGVFRALKEYADAPRYAMYCEAVSAGENGFYPTAVLNFTSLGDFLDSPIRAAYYAALSYEYQEKYEDAAELLNKISLFKDSNRRLLTYPGKIKERDYRLADEAEQDGRLEYALSMFKKLIPYRDSESRAEGVQEKINARDYDAASELETQNKLEEALKAFIALGDYRDSAARADAVQEKINERDYQQAAEWESKDELDKAYEMFVALGSYRDSAERAAKLENEVMYRRGMQYLADAKSYSYNASYKEAYNIFTALGDYKDSTQKAYDLGLTSFASFTYLDDTTASFKFHDKWGIVNFASNTITRPTWQEVSYRTNNCMMIKDDGKYGLADADGNILSECKWNEITNVGDGLLIARKMTYREKTSYYSSSRYYSHSFTLLKPDGTEMLSEYKCIGASNFTQEDTYASNYSIKAPAFYDGLMRIRNKDDLWGFVDVEGQIVIPCSYQSAHEFFNGVAAVRENGKWGYIDTTGNYVIQPMFIAAQDFNKYGLAEVQTGSGWNVIDKDCNLIYFIGSELISEADEGGYARFEAAIWAIASQVEAADEVAAELTERVKNYTAERGMTIEEFFEEECGGTAKGLAELFGYYYYPTEEEMGI